MWAACRHRRRRGTVRHRRLDAPYPAAVAYKTEVVAVVPAIRPRS